MKTRIGWNTCRYLLGALTVCLLVAARPSVVNAEITFEFDFSENNNAQAQAGFIEASNIVKSLFDDDVTFKIQARYVDLGGGGILGSAGSTTTTMSYSDFSSRINSDQLSADDNTFASNLPNGNSFSTYVNHPANGVDPFVDSSGSNSNSLRMTTANAKALGVNFGASLTRDARISFNSRFTWDFDRSDGIDSNQYDFVGVALHEIIHAMGFTSGADRVDTAAASDDPDNFLPSALDFTRHSADSLAAGADLDITADTRSKFFSIDGGDTRIGPEQGWSTGVFNGDGNQASHWKDNLGLGALDPTAAQGEFIDLTERDLMAMDVVGWNRVQAVPEPAAYPVLFAAAALLVWRRNRSRRRQRNTEAVSNEIKA